MAKLPDMPLDSASVDEIKRLAGDPWGSGNFVVEKTGEVLVLRKRHYPFLVTLWSLAIMGPLCLFFYKAIPSKGGTAILGLGIGVLLLVFFVTIFFYLDSKPPLLRWDTVSGTLALKGKTLEAKHRSLSLGAGEVIFRRGVNVRRGEALYIRLSESEEPLPLYVESVPGNIRPELFRLAKLGKVQVFQMPAVDLSGKG